MAKTDRTEGGKPENLEGRTAHGSDGSKIGKLEEVYLDQQTDRPSWGVVKTGHVGGRRFVPLSDARSDGDDVRLGVTKDQIKDAPSTKEDEHLSPEVESRLREHYGGGAGARGRSESREGGEGRRRSVGKGEMAAARTAQHEEHGGMNIGASLLGWLVAGGIAAILTAIVSAAGAAIGLTEVSGSAAQQNAGTIGVVGGIVLLLVLMVAYFAGGYNAGRLSRFDGGRQGFGVWIVGLVITLLIGAAGAIFGSEYNVLAQLQIQPRVPVSEGALATGGLIALAAIVLGTLLAAILGGKTGERYHKKVDRSAYGE